MLPKMTPMRLTQQAKPFDHPEWLSEVKFDGFRALAYNQSRRSGLALCANMGETPVSLDISVEGGGSYNLC